MTGTVNGRNSFTVVCYLDALIRKDNDFMASNGSQKRHRLVRVWISCLVCLIWIRPGMAETMPAYTIKEAVSIALQHNKEFKLTAMQVDLANLTVAQNEANFLPNLNTALQTSDRYAKSVDAMTGKRSSDNNFSMDVSVSSSVNLFNGFGDTATLAHSRYALKSTESNVVRQRHSVIYTTITRFVQVVTAQDAVRVEQENLAAQKLQLQKIQAFYESGNRPVSDVYQQEADIAEAELRVLNTERNVRVAKLLLMETLGLEPNTDYDLDAPEIDRMLHTLRTMNPTDSIAEIVTRRPDYVSQQTRIEAAREQITIARSDYYPSVALSANTGTSYSESGNRSGSFGDQIFDYNPYVSMGFSIQLPIFDRHSARINTSKATIQLTSEQLKLDQMRQQISIEYRQAIQDYQTAIKQVDVSESKVKFTRQSLESYQERYNVKASTLVELSQARTQYLQALYDQINAKYNLLLRGVAIAYYAGDEEGMMVLLEVGKGSIS